MQKVHLGGPKLTSYFLVSGPKFTGLLSLNAGGIALDHMSFPILDMLIRSRDICNEIQEMHKIAPNFACFWSPDFFWGGGNWIIKRTQIVITDHVAKFHGDWPSELGDLAAKGIKTSVVKHKSVQNAILGSLNCLI